MSATYTWLEESGSRDEVWLWNCGLTASDSKRALIGPIASPPPTGAMYTTAGTSVIGLRERSKRPKP